MTTPTYSGASATGAGTTTDFTLTPISGSIASLPIGSVVLFLAWRKDSVSTSPIACTTASHGLTGLGEVASPTGVGGGDAGPVRISGFYRVVDGTELSSYNFGSSGNTAMGQAFLVTKGAGSGSWSIAAAGGIDTTGGTPWSVTTGAIDLQNEDLCIVGSVTPTDTYSGGPTAGAAFSAETISEGSLTFGAATEIGEPNTAAGQDLGAFIFRQAVTAGADATATPTVTATVTGDSLAREYGATMLVRFRLVPDPPGVPTSVAASNVTGTSADLSWAAPATGGSVTSYETRLNGGSASTSTSPHTFSGLTPATAYTLEVRAVGPGGNSAWVGGMITTDGPPGIPTTVVATPDIDEIVLTWAAPASGGPVTGYDVQLDSGTITDVGNVLTHTFTGLTPGTTYTVKVRAHGGGGNSAFVSTVTETLGPPDEPTDVDATATSSVAITMTWDPPAGGGPVDHYEVRIDGGGPTDVGTVETWGFTGLTPATEYTVEVRAVNDAGGSAWVPVVLETPPPPPVDVYLRLEVEGDPPAGKIRNLLTNPNGDLGGEGWVTPTNGATLGGVNDPFGPTMDPGTVLGFTSGGGAETYFTSDSVPVTPGEFLWARWYVPTVDGYYRVFMDYAGLPTEFGEQWEPAVAPTSFGLTGAVTGVDVTGGPLEVPSDVIKARLRIEHYSDIAGTPSVAGDKMTLEHAGIIATETAGPVDWSDVVDAPDIDWLDVLGPTHEITVERAVLDLGTLEATILDATLDPAAVETLATGRGCRLHALSAMTGEWLPIFTGRIDQAKVTYDTRKQAVNPDDPKTARISITAHDATTQLAASSRPNGYGTVDELRAVLEGTGVPWNINGETGQIAGAVVVSRNESASAVDQIAITRDSAAAYAWLDRYGVLQAWNRDELVDGPAVVLDEDRYNDLQLSYDSEALINSVAITYLTYDPATGETTETKYGPFLAGNVGTRGEHRAEFTLHGLVPPGTDPASAVADFAQAVLDANAVPTRTCESLTIPIRNSGEVTTSRAFLDMYRLVRVANTLRSFDQELRVTGISHRISAAGWRNGKWLATYSFAPLGSVASPQVTPPLPPKPTAGWTPVVFTNGWTDFGGSEQVAQYRKLGDRVEVRGVVKDGTPGTQVFQLPEGFRPPANQPFVQVSNGGAMYQLDVLTSGALGPLHGGEDTAAVAIACQFSTSE